jgi:biotin transport system substrate-specific component
MRNHIFACVFASLITAGAFMTVPLPGNIVPLVLQNMLAIMSGLVLGPLLGFESVVIFLIIGALGVPVFSGGKSGIAHLLGPTGGFLFGYAAASFLAGVLVRKGTRSPIMYFIGSFAAFIVVDIAGVAWLASFPKFGIEKAIIMGLLPFILGDSIKAFVAALISWRIAPFAQELIYHKVSTSTGNVT